MGEKTMENTLNINNLSWLDERIRKQMETESLLQSRLKYYTQYKGIWYRLESKFLGRKNQFNIDVWRLSDSEDDMTGNLMTFNADYYRIDQCFTRWFEQYGE